MVELSKDLEERVKCNNHLGKHVNLKFMDYCVVEIITDKSREVSKYPIYYCRDCGVSIVDKKGLYSL